MGAPTALKIVSNKETCHRCGIDLFPGKNWSEWHQKRRDKICGSCVRKRHKWWRDNRREEVREREHIRYVENREAILARQKIFQEKNAERYAYRRNKDGAKSRNILFFLSFEEYMQYWQKPCEYCGADIATIGLDRVDNTGNYEMGNIVPCCVLCNRMKANRPLEVFIGQCKKIYERYKTCQHLHNPLQQG
jgi:hypothetical protein